MKKSDQLRGRWNANWTRTENHNLETTFLAALHYMDVPASLRAEIAKPGNLTAKGVDEKYRKDIAKTVGQLKRDERSVEINRFRVAERKSNLSKVKVDKADVAGALRRQELRQHVKSSSTKMEFLFDAKNFEFAEAVLETHPALSGLSAEQFTDVQNAYIQNRYPSELAELAELEEIVATLAAVQSVAREAILKDSGLTGRGDIAKWWDEIPAA